MKNFVILCGGSGKRFQRVSLKTPKILAEIKPGIRMLDWLLIDYLPINSRIILGLIFIFVLIPIGLVMKFFGYDPLKIRSPRNITYKHSRKNHTINLNRIF